METNNFTSVALKTNLFKLYEDSISSICDIIAQIGSGSYSMSGYWMSSEVSFFLAGNCIGPNLIHISEKEKSLQITKIGKYRNGSGSSFEIRSYYDHTKYIILLKNMNVRDFQYRTIGDFLPSITILRSLEYIESSLK